MEVKVESCPQCGSRRLFKNGMRYTHAGEIQRHLCRECGYTFSERPSNVPKFSPILNLLLKRQGKAGGI